VKRRGEMIERKGQFLRKKRHRTLRRWWRADIPEERGGQASCKTSKIKLLRRGGDTHTRN